MRILCFSIILVLSTIYFCGCSSEISEVKTYSEEGQIIDIKEGMSRQKTLRNLAKSLKKHIKGCDLTLVRQEIIKREPAKY